MGPYFRLEVYDETWIGYWRGLNQLVKKGKAKQDVGDIDCFMTAPPYERPWPNAIPQPNLSWATARGWKAIQDNIRDAILICDHHDIPWRAIRVPDLENIVWRDPMSEEYRYQVVTHGPITAFRVLRKGNCPPKLHLEPVGFLM